MKMRYIFAAVVLLFSSGCSDSVSNYPFQSTMQQILETGRKDYSMDKPGFGGGLAMQIFSPDFDGFLSTEMEDAQDYSSFRCASTTKTFTAAAVMLLHQQGLLDINDYITSTIPGTSDTYIPDTPGYDIPFKSQITIRMLLMHRAGVFDLINSDVPEGTGSPCDGTSYVDYVKELDPHHQFSFDELLDFVALYQLFDSAPGERYSYSNTGYSLLGKIIERVSGISYKDFLMEELIMPNGLIDTFPVAESHETNLPLPFIPGYVYTGEDLIDVTEDNLTANIAEGNIITTPHDLALWCKRLMSGKAGLTIETVNMMMQAAEPQAEGSAKLYGLGLEYIPSLGWGHNGAHQGYLTDMYYNKEKNAACVMFSNVWDISGNMDSIVEEASTMRSINNSITDLLGQSIRPLRSHF